MDFRAQLGANLKKARLAIDLSQEDLAHQAGLDRTYVSGIERGVRNPTVLVLVLLAHVLGVPPSNLLDGIAVPNTQRKR